MKFIDFFAGVGGFTRGFELAGHECIGHCEFDKYAEASYRAMHTATDDVFVVWFCKTLQNSKALLSTNVSDGMYYKITYNGDKNECYLDTYKKWQNILIEMW